MKIIHDISLLADLRFPVLTIGTFDGVHIGHQNVLKHICKLATENGGESVVITFDPHPRKVIQAESDKLKLLTTEQEKYSLIEKTGVDYLLVVPFSIDTANLSPEEFIEKYIRPIKIRLLVFGHDHHFGKDRSGNYERIQLAGRKYGFDVIELNAESVNKQLVSSTLIREKILQGKIKDANELLGYHFIVSGRVTYGNHIGKKLGFPTANIEVVSKEKIIPGQGVYAVLIFFEKKWYRGMVNIGFRPTLNQSTLTIEANIFGFDQDIYKKNLSILFADWIRNERKFPDITSLRLQLEEDKLTAMKLLNNQFPEDLSAFSTISPTL